MAERLGIVLYWTGCILAGSWLLTLVGFWYAFGSQWQVDAAGWLAITVLPALALWLLGKGLRYIFSGY